MEREIDATKKQGNELMNGFFMPNVPNGKPEVLELFGAPITLPTDGRLSVVTLPESIGNITHIHVHQKLATVFQDVFAAIWNEGYWKMLQNCMGVWNYRDKRTVNSLSLHSWGIAIDLNTIANPQGLIPPQQFAESRSFTFTADHPIVTVFRSHGFMWGGDFEHEKDAMHFQYATGC